MNKKKEIILYEINELPEIILNRFKKIYKPFNDLIEDFSIYKTINKDKVKNLSPWITWPTLHRGVNFCDHQISNLGQDLSTINNIYPPLWEKLKSQGYSVGVYGSLHSNYLPENYKDYDFYIPDAFSPHSICNPESLKSFQEFQLKLSRKSGRNVSKNFMRDLPNDLLFLFFKSGISIKTFLKILNQLSLEKIDKTKFCRRRVFQTIVNFDIYLNLLKKKNPNFSTFFTNHLASALHRYWEAAFPFDYVEPIQPLQWRKSYRNEIYFSMQIFYKQIRDLINYSRKRENCEIWICSSMGQTAVKNYKVVSSQLFITNEKSFFHKLGIDFTLFNRKPTMMPRYTYESKNLEEIKKLSNKLLNLYIDNKPVALVKQMDAESNQQTIGGNTISLRIISCNKIPKIHFYGKECTLTELGMEMIEVDDKSGTSAYHIPQGVLMIFGADSNRFNSREEINTINISKMIIDSINS